MEGEPDDCFGVHFGVSNHLRQSFARLAVIQVEVHNGTMQALWTLGTQSQDIMRRPEKRGPRELDGVAGEIALDPPVQHALEFTHHKHGFLLGIGLLFFLD